MEKELRKETLKILRSGQNIFNIYGIPEMKGVSMTLIELLNKIANNEVKDKTKYRIYLVDIDGVKVYRDIYYDQSETVAMDCLKNISDDYPIYDEIGFTDTIIEEIKE